MAKRNLRTAKWDEVAAKAGYDSRKLAKLFKLSARQMEREFQRQLGRTPQRLLEEQRIIAGQRLLLSGLNVKQIVIELGYKHETHFYRKFKIQCKITPSEFAALADSVKNVAQG